MDITWNERAAKAWVPAPVTRQELELSERTVRATEQAAAAVIRAAERLPPAWETLGRLLLRAEGVASSNIEGLRAPVALVAAAEVERGAGGDESAAWIARNLDAVALALTDTKRKGLSVAMLQRWHRALMRDTNLPAEMVGRFRRAQGWIGGTITHRCRVRPDRRRHTSGR